jgi:hypothetical protein
MRRILRQPCLHLLLLGALLCGWNTWRKAQWPQVLGCAGTIEINAPVIEQLCADFEREFGHAPDNLELRARISAHIREEVYFREALELGLDGGQSPNRRRLAQKMEFLTEDLFGAMEWDEAQLREYFQANLGRYQTAVRFSFRHVYFSRERRGEAMKALAQEALRALEHGADESSLGDPFLLGHEFEAREARAIGADFGPEFALALHAQASGVWRGPLESSFGLHLVYVSARSTPQTMSWEAARSDVEREHLEQGRRRANLEAYARLQARYRVELDELALSKYASESANHRPQGQR